MDRNFRRALSLVLKHEGGWADHPKDPGGATMKGVTLASFRKYVKRYEPFAAHSHFGLVVGENSYQQVAESIRLFLETNRL